ncbi:MAG: hypothetical protein FWE56_04565 [Candidatus Bathyarchaeota archaeon]|nr:hypothetical protein [Candidatus Termiticorpusculum sp.]MCL2868828.1 hypothetical protein [Candidatus Termiticorpusculum sp.]
MSWRDRLSRFSFAPEDCYMLYTGRFFYFGRSNPKLDDMVRYYGLDYVVDRLPECVNRVCATGERMWEPWL